MALSGRMAMILVSRQDELDDSDPSFPKVPIPKTVTSPLRVYFANHYLTHTQAVVVCLCVCGVCCVCVCVFGVPFVYSSLRAFSRKNLSSGYCSLPSALHYLHYWPALGSRHSWLSSCTSQRADSGREHSALHPFWRESAQEINQSINIQQTKECAGSGRKHQQYIHFGQHLRSSL